MSDPVITHHETARGGEYRARVEDSGAFGRMTWVRSGNARLVEAIVADARAQGFKVIPQCSYVVAAFDRHPDWADIRS